MAAGTKQAKQGGKGKRDSCEKGHQLYPDEMRRNGVRSLYSKRIGSFPGNGTPPKNESLR